MAIWHINGGNRLNGAFFVQGSKNSALPIIAACALSPCVTELMNVPRLSDVEASLEILRHLGCTAHLQGNDVYIDSTGLSSNSIPRDMMERMRSSVLFMGALMARCGEARLYCPGGCRLGDRPIDMHLSALKAMGAEISEDGDEIVCKASQLRGAVIELKYPSVGATENTMLAACRASGTTVIKNAAKEPEIVDLEDYLIKQGAFISGAGTDTVTVEGFSAEKNIGHRISSDRMAAATYLCATAACGGDIELYGIDPLHIFRIKHFLKSAGCDIILSPCGIRLRSEGKLKAVGHVLTEPYPGFPTDAQPLLMAAILKAEGESVFTETVFPNRFCHARELMRFGADIDIVSPTATVRGVKNLTAASVTATDLRGGAAMLIAAMCAHGESSVTDSGHILRGYERPDAHFRALGADITLEK